MKFQIGDEVQITRAAQSHERGWKNSWVPLMDAAIGMTGTVTFVDPSPDCNVAVHIPCMIAAGDYGYPDFVLRLVRRAEKI